MTDFLLGVETGTTHIWAGRFGLNLDSRVWTSISTNTASAVDPEDDPLVNPNYQADADWHGQVGFECMMSAWCGGAYCSEIGQNGALVILGGGHQCYFGNELIQFSFDTFEWTRITDPTFVDLISVDTTFGEYQTGVPSASHTYSCLGYNPVRHEFIMPTVTSIPNGVLTAPTAHVFDIATETWRRGGSYTQGASAFTTFSTWDTNRNVMWGGAGALSPFYKYDSATDLFTEYTNLQAGADTVCAIDPDKDLFVFTGSLGVRVIDLTTPNTVYVTVSTVGTPPTNNGAKYGFEWCPPLSKFVLWNGGTSLITLEPPATNWATNDWTWGTIAAVGGTPDAAETNGTYNRMRWIPNYNCIAVVNSTTGAVWAFDPV